MHDEPEAQRLTLGRKLGLAFLIAGLVVTTLAFTLFSPRAAQSFGEKSDVLVERGSDALREAREEVVEQSRGVLTGLIDHTTRSRQRLFEDLPLELYRGDTTALREAVKRRDEDLGERLRKNVEILSEEMDRRVREQIARSLVEIQSEQRALRAGFASSVQVDFLVLALGVFLLLFGALGFGLFRSVVRPVQRLRDSARQVAGGDLDVVVQTSGAKSGDEVDALAREFQQMVEQLRAARSELREKNAKLAEFNESLSSEVERQTAHLEKALEDLRGAQDQLVHAAKMSSVGTLAGGVAHEFGNLIAGIKGCAQDVLEVETDPGRREPLELIERTAERADQVTRGLLRFARRERGAKVEIDLLDVLHDARRLVEPQARKVGIAFQFDSEVFDSMRVPADPGAIQQVFVNLFTNAIQASSAGDQVEVRLESAPGGVLVRVCDHGVGIPEADLGHVFDPFFTTKDKETDSFRRGTGLGLAVSYGVIQDHGGRIEVRSEEGVGTTFEVQLPTGDDGGDERVG